MEGTEFRIKFMSKFHGELFTTLDLNILFLLTIVRYPMAITKMASGLSTITTTEKGYWKV